MRFAAPDPQDAVRQLVMAAKSGDPAYLGELLDSGVPVDQMDADSVPPRRPPAALLRAQCTACVRATHS